jgi:hypothetical protein
MNDPETLIAHAHTQTRTNAPRIADRISCRARARDGEAERKDQRPGTMNAQIETEAAMPGSLNRMVRVRLQRELKEAIKWLNQRDPKKQSERMQGAKYAYKTCWKRLQRIGYEQ